MKFILNGVDISLLEIKRLTGTREFQEGETDFEFMVFDPKIIKTGEITVRLTDLSEELQKSWLDFKKSAEASLKARILDNIMKEVNFDIPFGISVSELAEALKEKGETRAERMLRNSASATIRVRGKKVIENGKVLDVEWLKEKLAKIRTGPNPPG